MKQLHALLIGILVLSVGACRSVDGEQDPSPQESPTAEAAQLRGAWFGLGGGRAILDLRIGGGPAADVGGLVEVWLNEASFDAPDTERDPDLEFAIDAEGDAFPWSTEFFQVVDYDEAWESLDLRARITVKGGIYLADVTIERPTYVDVIWEFFRDEQLVQFFQPEITGKIGFVMGSDTDQAIFDLSGEGEEVVVETPEVDPPFERMWMWRYEEEPRGWPTPTQRDAFHDESWPGGTLSATISGADVLDRPELTEVPDDTDVWLYAMVEYEEEVGGLFVKKYWQYKSRVPMRAKIGVARSIVTRRKDNPTGIGPSPF